MTPIRLRRWRHCRRRRLPRKPATRRTAILPSRRRGKPRCPASIAGDAGALRPSSAMTSLPPPEENQDTFISHLIELRGRLVRSIVAVVVVLLCLVPWAKEIYAILAAPLLKALPQGATMIAT